MTPPDRIAEIRGCSYWKAEGDCSCDIGHGPHCDAAVFLAAIDDRDREIERLRELLEIKTRFPNVYQSMKEADEFRVAAFRAGAEAMREAAAEVCDEFAGEPSAHEDPDVENGEEHQFACERLAEFIRALPVPEAKR